MSFKPGSKGLNTSVQYTTLFLVGGQNVTGSPGMRTDADLRVAGGSYIGKDLYVRGTTTVQGNVNATNLNVQNQIICESIRGNLAAFAYITE